MIKTLMVLLSCLTDGCDCLKENENLHHVFVFGTMKRGEPLHHFLENSGNRTCQFVSKAHTIEKLPMIIATKYNVPIVLYRPDEGHVIHGELYKMNLPMIKKIEKYEYLPHEIIGRIEVVEYNMSENNKKKRSPAIMFVKYYVEDDSWLELPFISDYHSKGSHGLEFIERPVKHTQKKKKKRKIHKKDKNHSEGDIVRMKRRMERSYNKMKMREASQNKSISTTAKYILRDQVLNNNLSNSDLYMNNIE